MSERIEYGKRGETAREERVGEPQSLRGQKREREETGEVRETGKE